MKLNIAVMVACVIIFGCEPNTAPIEEAQVLQIGSVDAGTNLPSIRYPIGSGSEKEYQSRRITQDFGVWSIEFKRRHLGQDVKVPTEMPIFAIAPGVVAVSDAPEHVFPGYGNACGAPGRIIVIEHALPDQSKATCLYAPMQAGFYRPDIFQGLVPEGTIVSAGQFIGNTAEYLADTDHDRSCDDVNWAHLHFGCRLGPYEADHLLRYTRSYNRSGEEVDYDDAGTARGGFWTHPEKLIKKFRK